MPQFGPAEIARRRPSMAIATASPARRKDPRRVEDLMQYGLLLSAWIMAFMLGKELQLGFVQWRGRRRSPSE